MSASAPLPLPSCRPARPREGSVRAWVQVGARRAGGRWGVDLGGAPESLRHAHAGRLRAHARQWAAQTDDSVSDAMPAAAAAVLSLSISKLRQKATLIFRAKVPRLRTHAKQSKACSRTHSSSCSKCSKPAASQQHVGIGTVIDSACRIGNRELKSTKGMAVASAVVFHRPPSSAPGPHPGARRSEETCLLAPCAAAR